MRCSLLLIILVFVAWSTAQEEEKCDLVEYMNGTVCSFCRDVRQNRCTGCNGLIPPPGETPVIFDLCGACNGLGGTCRGCDGVYGSGLDYDECGICGGINECANNATDAVVFFPDDFQKSKRIYRFPLKIQMRSSSLGASIFYRYSINNEADVTLTPPNLFSIRGSEIITSVNITIKAIALLPGRRLSVVTSAVYIVSENGVDLNFQSRLFPVWAIITISVGGSILILSVVILIALLRIRHRMKMVDIRIEESERASKEDAYRALFDYEPQYSDEIELKVGDVLLVTKRHENGWWEGKSYRLKGKEGLFPASYVEIIPPERLMWVERPKTIVGRLSHRLSSMFAGVQYGTDPQISARNSSRFSKRVSKIIGKTINESEKESIRMSTNIPQKPTVPLPPKPQKPDTPLPPKPDQPKRSEDAIY